MISPFSLLSSSSTKKAQPLSLAPFSETAVVVEQPLKAAPLLLSYKMRVLLLVVGRGLYDPAAFSRRCFEGGAVTDR